MYKITVLFMVKGEISFKSKYPPEITDHWVFIKASDGQNYAFAERIVFSVAWQEMEIDEQ